MSAFYKYFKENMDALGMPAPESLFGSVQTTVSTVTAILVFIDKLGPKVTVKEMVGAGTRLEGLGTVGACAAAFYIGAVIGSLAVASGRSLGNGTSLGDVLFEAARWGFSRPWLAPILQRMPGIYNPGIASRSSYKNFQLVA
jgi:hypothetical protein